MEEIMKLLQEWSMWEKSIAKMEQELTFAQQKSYLALGIKREKILDRVLQGTREVDVRNLVNHKAVSQFYSAPFGCALRVYKDKWLVQSLKEATEVTPLVSLVCPGIENVNIEDFLLPYLEYNNDDGAYWQDERGRIYKWSDAKVIREFFTSSSSKSEDYVERVVQLILDGIQIHLN